MPAEWFLECTKGESQPLVAAKTAKILGKRRPQRAEIGFGIGSPNLIQRFQLPSWSHRYALRMEELLLSIDRVTVQMGRTIARVNINTRTWLNEILIN